MKSVKPIVSSLFRPSARTHGIAWYRSDLPDTAYDATFDEEPAVASSASTVTNAVKTKKDKLCALCSSLDLEKAFHYGLDDKTADTYHFGIGGIFYGTLDDVSRRKACPLCRLVVQLYCAKYRLPDLAAGSAFVPVDDIMCTLFTIASDEVGYASQLNGPPIHYLDVKFYLDAQELAPTSQRYLMLDAEACNLVDASWRDIQRTIIATDEGSSDSEPDEVDAHEGRRAVVEYDDITDSDGDDDSDTREPDGQPRWYYNTGRRIRQSQVDFELLRSWLSFCEDAHEWRGCFAAPTAICSSFRVIDVKSRQIVPMPRACRYVALSYVWGAVEAKVPFSLSQGRLPHTIEDAMVVVERLGERYLWVDAYCIDQDDNADKAAQVKLMHQIYNCAVFTIIAATGPNSEAGLAGVYPGSRLMTQQSEMVDGKRIHVTLPMLRESLETPHGNIDTADDSIGWINRGWTMQEGLLSRRCLIFSASQVFFQCCSGFCAESITEVMDHQRRAQVATSNQAKDLVCGNLVRLMDGHKLDDLIHYDTTEYFRFIGDYTRRSLTFGSDRLHAIKGITTALSLVYGTTFLWGLPQGALDFALLWVPTSLNNESKTELDFPSWSWASWPGSIDYYVYDNDSVGANEMINTSGDLLETGANIRKHNTYWKYNCAAQPKQVVQKQVRYPNHIEKKHGCVKKDGKVKLDTHIRAGVRPQLHLLQLNELVTDVPLLNRELRPKLNAGDQTALPVLGFNAVRAQMHLLEAMDGTRQFQCRCKVSNVPAAAHSERTQPDECIFVDRREDMLRLNGQLCDFVFLSICEPTRSPYTLLVNVLLVEKCADQVYKRVGVGYMLSTTWAAAKQIEETVFLI